VILKVTVDVDAQDIRDTLTWFGGQSVESHRVNAWLTAYVETDGERREAIWRAMPPSLQWCVHEYERRGPERLLSALATLCSPTCEEHLHTEGGEPIAFKPEEDEWCRVERWRFRNWQSGSMPTHKRGPSCPPPASASKEPADG